MVGVIGEIPRENESGHSVENTVVSRDPCRSILFTDLASLDSSSVSSEKDLSI